MLIPVAASSKVSTVAARLLRSWVRIPPVAWRFVCCECCVLWGRGLCDGLITRPAESYRLWCVVVCDLETSWMSRPWSSLDHRAIGKEYIYIYIYIKGPPKEKCIHTLTKENSMLYVSTNFNHTSQSQMKHQLDATLCRFYFCRVTLHVSDASAHHQEYLKLVQRPLVHVLSL